MPNCFQLLDKQTKEPQSLNTIDEEICKLMGVQVHPKHYGDGIYNWFDTIGFQLATGKDLDDNSPNSVREYYKSSEMWTEELPWLEKIITYLQSKYTDKSFYATKEQLA